MDIWISMHNSQMANNIVKWWKTKFLNGYKQFSVECGDGKVSDTEELLGRLGSEESINRRLNATCTTPPVPDVRPPTVTEETQTPSSKKAPSELNFEEFSCDVSLENGDTNKASQERREFSFTLYDFDGHGKITKDDIAGLVTTIYEALGSSVKVPHYGSKTIKVKLTVSPDQRKHVSATIINKEEKPEESSIRYKRDLNVTISQGDGGEKRNRRKLSKRRKNTKKKHECCNKQQQHQQELQDHLSDDSSEVNSSRLSDNLTTDDEEDEPSDNEKNNKNNNNININNNNNINRKSDKKYHKNSAPRYTIPNVFFKESNILNQNNYVRGKAQKKRSGSMQRQELLEIIQANMDKNDTSFQTAKENASIGDGSKQLSLDSPAKQTHPLQYLARIVDPTHFYVDLGSLQNTTHLPQTHCQYDKLIDAVMCVSNKKITLNKPKCKRPNVKQVLSEMPFQCQLLSYPEEKKVGLKLGKKTSKRTVAGGDSKHNHHKKPQFVTGHTSSPHHLRHRNRQEDQARAMEQVVRWLEQEFSSNLHTRKTNNKRTKSNHFTTKEKTNSTSQSSPTYPGVERHEHHHIHEHIHHHYHHYQDAPPLVV